MIRIGVAVVQAIEAGVIDVDCARVLVGKTDDEQERGRRF